ncbi:MAG: hypothetical protein COZ21_12190 [Bacteroidetes bacterium CG_4_10_14_3_um_filter_31_20]|nr:MAG: hypothetical protein COZ21_12190 [Bacteroidetes bacterium CG_4_10_14_3_um_filter_31_20]
MNFINKKATFLIILRQYKKVYFMEIFKFTFIFFLISFSVSAQSSKVTDAFGKERVHYLQANYPDSLGYYNFVAEDGFSVSLQQYIQEEKLSTALPLTLPKVCINNAIPVPSCINIYTLPVTFHPTQNMYYLISGTDYVLVLRSKDCLFKKYHAKSK